MDVREITRGLERLHDILARNTKHDDDAFVTTTLVRKEATYALNLLNEAIESLNKIEYRKCPVCLNTYPWLKRTTYKTCRICFAKGAVNRAVVLASAGKGTGFGVTG